MGSSTLYPGEKIINDSTPMGHAMPPDGRGTGLVLDRPPYGYGYGATADPFPRTLLIPRSDWQGIIEDQEKYKWRLSDHVVQAALDCKDQEQTNYCWINAPVYAFEVIRVVANEPKVILSPASIGAKIKNFQNVGGWGEEGLRYLSDHGCVPVDQWPANAIDRQYDTPENNGLRPLYRCADWWELTRRRNLDELVTCILLGIPVPVGYNWWGHEVTGHDIVWLDGMVALRIRNSWGMGWGAMGFGILQGTRMLPDDAVAPRVAAVGGGGPTQYRKAA